MDKLPQPPPFPKQPPPLGGGIMSAAGMAELLQLGADALDADTTSSSQPLKWQAPSVEEMKEMLPQLHITKFVARGGMGAVYEGFQESLSRKVAVKILPPNLDDGGLRFVERFKAEARALAKLSHPGIVTIYDAGETANGLLYFVMELVEGTDLAKLISGGTRLTPSRAIQITSAVCDALSYAHGKGLIHRDIKPSNILIDENGRVKVTDFGLTKSIDGTHTALTRTNIAVGTPDFLAPEAMIAGCKVDERADIYAVGVMLYQMLTGHVPRGGYKPISSMVKEVDARYDGIVDKAMHVSREERYTTASEMKTALEHAQGRRPWLDSASNIIASARAFLPKITKCFRWSFWKHQLSWRFYVGGFCAALFTADSGLANVPFAVAASACLTIGKFAWKPRFAAVAFVAMSWLCWTCWPVSHWPVSPKSATASRPFINSLGMKFVPIPGTRVLIAVRPTERRAMGIYDTDAGKIRWISQSNSQSDPILGMPWDIAAQFTAWLSSREGRHYRLPTISEWRMAIAPNGYENGGEVSTRTEFEKAKLYRNRPTENNRLGVSPVDWIYREWCADIPVTEASSSRPMIYADSIAGDRAVIWNGLLSRTFTHCADFSEEAKTSKLNDPGFTFRCVLDLDADSQLPTSGRK